MNRMMVAGLLLTISGIVSAQQPRRFELRSPDGRTKISIEAGQAISWQVSRDQVTVLAPSKLSIRLQTGEQLGRQPKIVSAKQLSIRDSVAAVNYKKQWVTDRCNQLVLACKGDYDIVFRAYDDGVAYRFVTRRKEELTVSSEQAEYNFDQDHTAMIPFTSDLRGGDRYSCSFEEFYTESPLSKISPDTLGYLPALVKLGATKRVALLESDGQNYPGMFLRHSIGTSGLEATFAGYPLEESLGGFNRINLMVSKRADYIAKLPGTSSFPWRILVIADSDRDLLNNDMVYRLAGPSRITETNWIKPGKVAWDWWNDWNITHVDFRAGINTPTYEHYIDFAAANHIEYVVLDEGWSNDWDLLKRNTDIDLPGLVAHAREKNVGLILWSTWYAISQDMEGLCSTYAAMGIKGFKVDFIDRNDQKAIASCYQIAAIAAKYHLMLDFHGMFPPQGLTRTWPNVINFEAVRGMEYSKWSADDRVPAHEVTLPFIRMLAGPMDYTPGAMRNATRHNARPNNILPVSQGTRCHQLAIYTVFEGPLQMLADNPVVYRKEQECTDWIASLPTSFDETVALDGRVGEYVVLARRKGGNWYIGAMTNWTARDLQIDLSFLGAGEFQAELFADGVNADRDATDYRHTVKPVQGGSTLNLHLAPGGGASIRISKR